MTGIRSKGSDWRNYWGGVWLAWTWRWRRQRPRWSTSTLLLTCRRFLRSSHHNNKHNISWLISIFANEKARVWMKNHICWDHTLSSIHNEDFLQVCRGNAIDFTFSFALEPGNCRDGRPETAECAAKWANCDSCDQIHRIWIVIINNRKIMFLV